LAYYTKKNCRKRELVQKAKCAGKTKIFEKDLGKSDEYRIVRDTAAVKHGMLTRLTPEPRAVLQVRDLADVGVGAVTMRAGEDWLGEPVVYVVLREARRAKRLSDVLRSAARYVSELL
jgi:hypothetical protein